MTARDRPSPADGALFDSASSDDLSPSNGVLHGRLSESYLRELAIDIEYIECEAATHARSQPAFDVHAPFDDQADLASEPTDQSALLDEADDEAGDVTADLLDADDLGWPEPAEPQLEEQTPEESTEGLEDFVLDYDEEAVGFDLPAVPTSGKVPTLEIARRYAAALADRFGGDSDLLSVLERIFLDSSHYQTRLAIERLLTAGAAADALELALEVRRRWATYPEFWIVDAYGNRSAYLPWTVAILVVESFEGRPDPDEVEQVLLQMYDDYCESLEDQRVGSFVYYVRDRVRDSAPRMTVNPAVHIGCNDITDFDDGYLDGARLGAAPQLVRELRNYGLIPDLADRRRLVATEVADDR